MIYLNLACILIANLIAPSYACTSYYCVNKCGSSHVKNSGYKLILANNRDEDIYRPTWPAQVWPPRESNGQINALECDQSNRQPPFNLCVYGALDTANGMAPDYYSTWLGINERGSLGNLLFFMTGRSHTKSAKTKPRGVIVGDYLQNSSWPSVESFMQQLSDEKNLYKPFNYVQAEMTSTTGDYNLFYVNNNSSLNYKKLNQNTTQKFIFGISNSDPERPFQKVVNGEKKFNEIIDNYGQGLLDKKSFIQSLIDLLQNTTSNMPDDTLAAFMGKTEASEVGIVEGVSKIKANYSSFWRNGFTRTSTLILVDYENRVEYFEYNLTLNSGLINGSDDWKMNSFEFKLKPSYLNNSSSSRMGFINYFGLTSIFLALKVHYLY